jgi:hypothetical protein
MAEIGQLCKIELDQVTLYKIIEIRTTRLNTFTNETQTITSNSILDVEEVKNPNNKKLDIPIYNIHIIKEQEK